MKKTKALRIPGGKPTPAHFKKPDRRGNRSVCCGIPGCSGWFGYVQKVTRTYKVEDDLPSWEREETVLCLRPEFAWRRHPSGDSYMLVSKRAAKRLDGVKVSTLRLAQSLRVVDALNSIYGDDEANEDTREAKWREYASMAKPINAIREATHISHRNSSTWFELEETDLPLKVICPECGRLVIIKTLAGLFP